MRPVDPRFANISNYAKKEITPLSASEEWMNDHPDKRMENKPNGGIVRATTAAPFVDNLRGPDLTPAELKERNLQSQREHKAALKRARKVS